MLHEQTCRFCGPACIPHCPAAGWCNSDRSVYGQRPAGSESCYRAGSLPSRVSH
ncbi:hypothetical protein L248_2202 [Schleiferilactobacillus shenzhenensis LY-73]|uniref:4Fe-4S ferredoxin-type domain-containing protein n=1 Tax=Schleiferilactobacillus shenzhenensis LY-73 TaxID=1231336 RepID=U4TK88_9LACO|nr:hypothetical protein L248_2202 [Schleiferilactobacillus shenzhenensis LY-73]